MKIKDDEMIIKRREYIDLLMENAKLREQASPFHKYSINEIREMFGFSKIVLEENEVPEKLEYYDDSIAWVIDDVGQLSDVDKVIIDKLNEIIDYLKSKGDE